MPTLINFNQLSKFWKIVAGSGIVLVGVGGTVVTLSTRNAANLTTRTEYSDGRSTQSGTLTVKSGSLAVNLRPNGDGSFQGTLSGNKLYTGTMSGAGLTDCDAATDTLNWDTTTQRFLCGTDATGGGGTSFNSGQVLALGDPRYVNTAGDTMTGALNIQAPLSGSSLFTLSRYKTCTLKTTSTGMTMCGTDTDTNTTYTAGQGLTLTSTSFKTNSVLTGSLVSFSTVSGSIVHAKNSLASSGSLVVEASLKSGSGAAAFIPVEFQTGAYIYGSGASILALDTYTERTAPHILFGYRGNFDTDLYRSATTRLQTSGSLYVLNTISGSIIKAQASLSSSGSLTWGGAASGSSLYIATSLQGVGLTDCDIAGTSKLLWDSTTGRFSCGTDQGGGGGISQADGDARYVRKAGSTMTGALTIDITGGNSNTLGLNILNFLSGAVLHAEKTLTSSGNLVVENGSYLSGAVIMARGTYPSTPSNDHLALFANGGDFDREMLKVIDSDANNYHLQPSFFGNFIALVGPGSTATTLNSVGEGVTVTATLSQPTPTEAIPFSTNFATSTTLGNESGFIGFSTPYVRGSTTGANGFFFSSRVIPVDITLVRHFVGLTDQATLVAVMASDNIASHDTAQFQFSTVRGDTNWQFVTKDGTTQNVINTGMAVTANNTYDFYIYCKKQCSTMYWKIKNKTANTSAQGSTSSNLPGAAIFMRKFLGVETQVAGSKRLRMQSMYTEMQGAAN